MRRALKPTDPSGGGSVSVDSAGIIGIEDRFRLIVSRIGLRRVQRCCSILWILRMFRFFGLFEVVRVWSSCCSVRLEGNILSSFLRSE